MVAFLLLVAFLLATLSAPAQETLKSSAPLRVLLVGNSYTAAVYPHLAQLLKASGRSHEIQFPEDEFGLVRLNRFRNFAANTSLLARLKEGWDVVVLQDQSQIPAFWSLEQRDRNIDLEGSMAAGLKLAEAALSSPRTRVVCFASWARQDETLKQFDGKPEEMQRHTNRFYQELARQAGPRVRLAGVGDAFLRAAATSPDLTLLAQDRSHPAPAGAYLAACVLFREITGQSPRGLSYTGGLDKVTATFLRATVETLPR